MSERQSRQRRGSKVGEEEDPAQEKEAQQGREARSLCSSGSQVRKADDSCCEVKLDAQSPFLHFVGWRSLGSLVKFPWNVGVEA